MKKTFRHNDFTATFSDEGTSPDNRYFSLTGEIDGSSGATGDRIAAIHPPFQILEDLHLCDLNGEPMHALENAFYFFTEGDKKRPADKLFLDRPAYDPAKLEKYWHVTLTDDQKQKIRSNIFKHMARDEQAATLKPIVATIMEEIRPLWAEKVQAAYALIKATPPDLTEIDETINLDDFEEPAKVRALASHLDVHFSTIEEDGETYTAQGIEYRVLTDREADEAEDDALDSYLDECILPELPQTAQDYFDRDAWKKDARMDGRGHLLNSWDGEELEIVDPETKEMFFAYRR